MVLCLYSHWTGRGLVFIAIDYSYRCSHWPRPAARGREVDGEQSVHGRHRKPPIPACHEVEVALHSNGGMLSKQETSFSFF